MKKAWNNKEVALAYFLVRYKEKSYREIVNLLGRSYNSVYAMINRFKKGKIEMYKYSNISSIVMDLKSKRTCIDEILAQLSLSNYKENTITAVEKENKDLYAVGSTTSIGVCLQQKIHTEKEIFNKSIYKNKKQVFYKLVEVTVEQHLVPKQ